MPDDRSMPAPRPASRTEYIGVRVTPEEKQAIVSRADDRGMTITDYLIGAALERLDHDFVSAEVIWRERIEARLSRLEEFAFDTS